VEHTHKQNVKLIEGMKELKLRKISSLIGKRERVRASERIILRLVGCNI